MAGEGATSILLGEPPETETAELVAVACDELYQVLATSCSESELDKVRKACAFSAAAHEGQMRLSGEPFITHPLQVAVTMARLGMDCDSIVAGILHDTVEDTTVTIGQIRENFGNTVANIVAGVSKIEGLQFADRQVKQAKNFQKMMLAMTGDVRVILVKLADRLHNMRTICYIPLSKRRFIARETLEIYAPIARRLGMNKVGRELENLGFSSLYPLRHKIIRKALATLFESRRKLLSKVQRRLTTVLRKAGIRHKIHMRYKRPYSVYCKMRRKGRAFSGVMDVFALRVIVGTVDECFSTLGLVHGIHRPVPGRFKDYISLPKENGYQSLHTVLVLPGVSFMEMQIRTAAMDQVAEEGIAAHASYKLGEKEPLSANYLKVRAWARNLLETKQHPAKDSLDFFEDAKLDFYVDEVHVFTPQGRIMVLPHGARVIDFAFAVHTDVGLSCLTALVDQQQVPLSEELRNGQTVEIKIAAHAHPEPEWLGFAMTAKARSAIRGYLKNMREEQSVFLGKRLLSRALAQRGTSLEDIASDIRDAALREYGFTEMTDLLREIGLGRQLPALVALCLVGTQVSGSGEPGSVASLPIVGTEGFVVNYARCCYPIPGDQICGKLSAEKGLVVHRIRCRNLGRKQHKNMSFISLHWSLQQDVECEFPVVVKVEVMHKRGVLAVIAGRISEAKSNIENIALEEKSGSFAVLTFTLSVKNEVHLEKILRRVRSAGKGIRASRAF